MKFHGINMQGKFQVQEVSTLPTFSGTDTRRIIYVSDEDKIYYGGETQWLDLSAIYGTTNVSFVNGGILKANNFYYIDTSSTAMSGTLDGTAIDGDVITILDEAENFPINSFTVSVSAGSGQTILENTSYICNTTNATIYSFIFSELYGWKLDMGGSSISTLSGGGGGGTAVDQGFTYTEFKFDDIIFDDLASAVEQDSIWGVIPCVNFDCDSDGAIWVSGRAPDFFDWSKDVKFKIIYNLAADLVGDVYLECKSWNCETGGSVSDASPTTSNNATITASASNKGKLSELAISELTISAASMTNPLYFTVKLLRDADNVLDTYDADFQLVSIVMYQD